MSCENGTPTKRCTVLLYLLLLSEEVIDSTNGQSTCGIAPGGYTRAAPREVLCQKATSETPSWLESTSDSMNSLQNGCACVCFTLARLAMTVVRTSLGESLPALNDLAPHARPCKAFCGCICKA